MAKILVVDDDPELTASVSALLEGHGYTVETAADGASGEAKAKAIRPDLMILDVMMKNDSEGFEVVRRLREDKETKNLPVIILTGIRKAKKLPFRFEPDPDWLPVKAVLEKPVSPENLLKAVEEIVGKN